MNTLNTKKLCLEFCKLLSVEHFVENFLSFLKAKQNAEALQFIIQFDSLQKDIRNCNKEDINQRIQIIMNRFVVEGSLLELNLPGELRKYLIERHKKWLEAAKCDGDYKVELEDFMINFYELKDLLLVQLKEERFEEFKKSEYWKAFEVKLNEPKVNSTTDFSFLWIIPYKQWSPKQVSLWLESMNIEEHILFEEHEIRGKLLPTITRDDLIRMGITKIGSLKRLLRLLQEVSQRK